MEQGFVIREAETYLMSPINKYIYGKSLLT